MQHGDLTAATPVLERLFAINPAMPKHGGR